MALEKAIQTPYDTIDATYWKVAETNINYLTNQAHVTLLGFVSKEARDAGKQSIMDRSYDWSGDDFPFTIEELDKAGINAVKLAYEKIKADEEFVGAKDI